MLGGAVPMQGAEQWALRDAAQMRPSVIDQQRGLYNNADRSWALLYVPRTRVQREASLDIANCMQWDPLSHINLLVTFFRGPDLETVLSCVC